MKWSRLTMVWIWYSPEHSKTEQMVAFLPKTIPKLNHLKTEQTLTIQIPNMFRIRAPTVFKSPLCYLIMLEESLLYALTTSSIPALSDFSSFGQSCPKICGSICHLISASPGVCNGVNT